MKAKEMKSGVKQGQKQQTEKYMSKVYTCVLARVPFSLQKDEHPKKYTCYSHSRVHDRAPDSSPP